MKILHIVHVNHMGNGITTVVINLSQAQRVLKNDVLVINLRKNAAEIEGFVKCTSKDSFKNILQKFKPEIIIFHGMFYKQIREYTHIVYAYNIPYLIEPHGAYSEENYQKNTIKKTIFRYCYLSKAIKNSRGWIFLNENEKNKFRLKEYHKAGYIVPNGCDVNEDGKLATTIEREYELNYLYLGRISIHHKGLDLLIEAIKKLAKENALKGIKFNFYGPGHSEDIKYFSEKIQELDDVITYHGPVYGLDKEEAIRNADIFILTSRFEGFPMSILESLSYGCPCLVSEGTNVAHIIKEYNCGWVIENLNSDTISQMIKKSAEYYKQNHDRLRYNAQRASREYTWDKIAQKSIETYKSVIKKK